MTKIDVDTMKLRECGNDIIRLSNETNEVFDDMFKRINNMGTKTHEWVGDSCIKFINKFNVESIEYRNFKEKIFNYGQYLVSTADLLDKTIESNKYKE